MALHANSRNTKLCELLTRTTLSVKQAPMSVTQNITRPSSVKAWLAGELESRCQRNPKYSLRAFARDLAISAPRLSRVLSGTEGISRSAATSLEAPGFVKEETTTFVTWPKAIRPQPHPAGGPEVDRASRRRGFQSPARCLQDRLRLVPFRAFGTHVDHRIPERSGLDGPAVGNLDPRGPRSTRAFETPGRLNRDGGPFLRQSGFRRQRGGDPE